MKGRRTSFKDYLRSRSLRGRLLWASTIMTFVALFLGAYVLSNIFEGTMKVDFDARMEVMMDGMVGASEVGSDEVLAFTRPVFDQRFDTPYSGFYWQISELDQKAFRSRSLWDQELSVILTKRLFKARWSHQIGPDNQVIRLLERDIILPESDRVFRYMVAVDTLPLLKSARAFDNELLSAFSMVAAAIIVAILVLVSYGVKPLEEVGEALKAVRSGKKSHIEGVWPEELAPLGSEINALIDHNDKVVTRARTHAGNLAHALKTPLTILSNEAQKSPSSPASKMVLEQISQMQSHIDHHLRRARISGRKVGAGASVHDVLNKITKVVKLLDPDKELEVTISCPETLYFLGEAEDLNEVAGNLIENAAKWAKGKVHIKAKLEADHQFSFFVEDDGQGVDEADQNNLFNRGERLDEKTPGTGLGLSIVKDVVDMYGGRVNMKKSKLGGFGIEVILPATS